MENFTIGQLLYTAQQNKQQIVAYFQNKETYDIQIEFNFLDL